MSHSITSGGYESERHEAATWTPTAGDLVLCPDGRWEVMFIPRAWFVAGELVARQHPALGPGWYYTVAACTLLAPAISPGPDRRKRLWDALAAIPGADGSGNSIVIRHDKRSLACTCCTPAYEYTENLMQVQFGDEPIVKTAPAAYTFETDMTSYDDTTPLSVALQHHGALLEYIAQNGGDDV